MRTAIGLAFALAPRSMLRRTLRGEEPTTPFDLLLGSRLVERWDLWEPSVTAMGDDVYPLFRELAVKMEGRRPYASTPEPSA